MIIGRDLLRELGITLNFDRETMTWDSAEIPMKDVDATINDAYHLKDDGSTDKAMERIKSILDAKYEPADLQAVVDNCNNLNTKEKINLLNLLEEYKDLFDGTLGTWKGTPYHVELKKDAEPYHARAFPIPKTYEQTLRMEVDRLVEIGVLKKVNRSAWAAPTFIIPKKDGTVRFISDFRELNKRIKRKPFPIPKIQDLLLKLEGFKYATSLDLNMGYYHVELSAQSKELCTIVLPWGKYEYQRLPMGLCNSPDIFQEKMGELMSDLEHVRTYIDDLLHITSGSFDDHLDKLKEIFNRLRNAGLKINASKSFFGRHELEYLGYWVTREGIQPVQTKVDAIQNIAPPKTKRELRKFIGIINYYRDMWIRRSELLAPLTALTSKNATWKWGDTEQTAFDRIKQIISKQTLLAYPNFNEAFHIHTDASHTQLGAVISQNEKPIAFYSRKLNPAQTRYTTTERELLSIVETLKEFRNILMGHKIKVFTDHKNLTYKQFNTERVMRWRLILEEFGPELIYIKGENNIVADALSRLDIQPTRVLDEIQLAELYGLDDSDLPENAFPLNYKNIAKSQHDDKLLMNTLQKSLQVDNSPYHIKVFRGGGKTRELVCYKEKIVIPVSLRLRVVQWYHLQLCHPGETRTEQTIRQHFWWPTLREDVANTCKTCDTCQKAKKSKKKYGHLPEKEADTTPWEKLCVDLIGPYTIRRKKGKPSLQLWCVTMIDPATGWFEMKSLPTKRADVVANIIEQTWFSRYPWPTIINLDRGSEFLAEFTSMIENDYGIKRKAITTRNPQANSVIERIHQVIGNIVRTYTVRDAEELDEENPWDGILSAVMFAIRATYHTTLQATPTQLVFGRDAILNTKFEANWKYIRERKQEIIRKNNIRENANRIPHEYKVGDKVLYKTGALDKFSTLPYEGPYVILGINTNGTVRLKRGAILDTVNIRLLHPYHDDM